MFLIIQIFTETELRKADRTVGEIYNKIYNLPGYATFDFSVGPF